ncbi:MAG TPA: hypothetical protein VM513_33890 [Kofleriaceae bacterium]|nr:hypothetical protein [Kofleriaceae bacterium]
MGKWLAIAGIVIIAVLVVLWQQLDSSSVAPAPRTAETRTAPPALSSAPPSAPIAQPVAEAAAPADVAPAKLDPDSDEFFTQFVEVVPKRLTAQAAACYEGVTKRVHRNQKLSLRFKTKIVNGVVTVSDVTIKENTLANPGLEACFLQAVQRATWTDEALPDYEAEDELVLRPERGMKKFMRDNLEYQGTAAPRAN